MRDDEPEEGMKATKQILDELAVDAHVQVRTSRELTAEVRGATAEEDEKRTVNKQPPLRRRSDYRAVTMAPRSLTITPWQLLHAMGLGAAVSRQGAGRGLAEHWGSLRYAQALERNHGRYLKLSSEGRDLLRFYKATQSGEIGAGFASLLAEEIVRTRYPDHLVSIVPADVTLRAGWPKLGTGDGPRPEALQRRPQFFVEAWRPGQPSKVILLASKGTHSSVHQVYKQLSNASAHVESVHIGPYGSVPYLLVGTEIPSKESLALHVLGATGTTALNLVEGKAAADLNLVPHPGNRMADALKHEKGSAEVLPGFHVLPEDFTWLSIVLARTAAAMLTAFTGGGKATGQYLTTDQGQRHFQHDSLARTGKIRDATHRILSIDFVGTDHIYRRNGIRVEAFSGLHADLYDHLRKGHVNEYRRHTYDLRDEWPGRSTAKDWNAVSIRADGTVMAIRLGET